MMTQPRKPSKSMLIAVILLLIGSFVTIFIRLQNDEETGKSDGSISSGPTSNLVKSPSPSNLESNPNSGNNEDLQGLQSQNQVQSQIDEQQQSNLAQSQAQQQGLIPARFACEVNGYRTGENRSILRLSVSAPNQIPEVWVSVKTESGVTQGSISLISGLGEQAVSLKNPTNGTRPEVKVYSRPIFIEQYEMCSFR